MDTIRRHCVRPYQATVIAEALGNGSHHAARPETVATHHYRVHVPFTVGVARCERLRKTSA